MALARRGGRRPRRRPGDPPDAAGTSNEADRGGRGRQGRPCRAVPAALTSSPSRPDQPELGRADLRGDLGREARALARDAAALRAGPAMPAHAAAGEQLVGRKAGQRLARQQHHGQHRRCCRAPPTRRARSRCPCTSTCARGRQSRAASSSPPQPLRPATRTRSAGPSARSAWAMPAATGIRLTLPPSRAIRPRQQRIQHIRGPAARFRTWRPAGRLRGGARPPAAGARLRRRAPDPARTCGGRPARRSAHGARPPRSASTPSPGAAGSMASSMAPLAVTAPNGSTASAPAGMGSPAVTGASACGRIQGIVGAGAEGGRGGGGVAVDPRTGQRRQIARSGRRHRQNAAERIAERHRLRRRLRQQGVEPSPCAAPARRAWRSRPDARLAICRSKVTPCSAAPMPADPIRIWQQRPSRASDRVSAAGSSTAAASGPRATLLTRASTCRPGRSRSASTEAVGDPRAQRLAGDVEADLGRCRWSARRGATTGGAQLVADADAGQRHASPGQTTSRASTRRRTASAAGQVERRAPRSRRRDGSARSGRAALGGPTTCRCRRAPPPRSPAAAPRSIRAMISPTGPVGDDPCRPRAAPSWSRAGSPRPARG